MPVVGQCPSVPPVPQPPQLQLPPPPPPLPLPLPAPTPPPPPRLRLQCHSRLLRRRRGQRQRQRQGGVAVEGVVGVGPPPPPLLPPPSKRDSPWQRGWVGARAPMLPLPLAPPPLHPVPPPPLARQLGLGGLPLLALSRGWGSPRSPLKSPPGTTFGANKVHPAPRRPPTPLFFSLSPAYARTRSLCVCAGACA